MNCNLSEDMILPMNIEETSSFDQPTHEITITSSASISLPGTSGNNCFLLFSALRNIFHYTVDKKLRPILTKNRSDLFY